MRVTFINLGLEPSFVSMRVIPNSLDKNSDRMQSVLFIIFVAAEIEIRAIVIHHGVYD